MTSSGHRHPKNRADLLTLRGEKANKRVYGKAKVLRFHDGPSVAETEQEIVVSK
jgi:hypothetical protein